MKINDLFLKGFRTGFAAGMGGETETLTLVRLLHDPDIPDVTIHRALLSAFLADDPNVEKQSSRDLLQQVLLARPGIQNLISRK